MNKINIPSRLQPLLWSSNINHLDIVKDKNYIIHQVLCYGSMNDFKDLFSIYSKQEVTKYFSNHPYKNYSPQRFNFIKNILLGLKTSQLNEKLYVQNIPRDIGAKKLSSQRIK